MDSPGTRRPARPVSLTPYRDGPVVVRGPFRLVDSGGREIHTPRRTVALCRCGHSRLGPVCDGTHRGVGFLATGGPAREVVVPVVVPLPVEVA